MASSKYIYIISIIILSLFLSACGGGDGQESQPNPTPIPHMSLSTHSIAITTKNTDLPAPSKGVYVTIHNLPESGLYVEYKATHHAIKSIELTPSPPNTVNVFIHFKSPWKLGKLGSATYKDRLKLAACLDKHCTDQIKNSPQIVNIKYRIHKVPNPVPSITALRPDSKKPGYITFHPTITGSGFVPTSTVEWDGHPLKTYFNPPYHLSFKLPASRLDKPGTFSVTVVNPEPGGGTSNSYTFTIPYVTPHIKGIFPAAVEEGHRDFTLTLVGDGFGPQSRIIWNGDSLSTDYVSVTELTAHIDASRVSSVGSATIIVSNPSPGGNSIPKDFKIKPYKSDSVAFQINASHSAATHFAHISFPSHNAWATNVGGKPSYALISDGKVFVTVQVKDKGWKLVALDQTTGHLVWKSGLHTTFPIANACYDSGMVFVLSSLPPESGMPDTSRIYAFDSSTGQVVWTHLFSFEEITAAPTAHGGFIYITSSKNGGTLYALDEQYGSIMWTQSFKGGLASPPAVVADSIYLTYPCHTYAFRPGTGEIVWENTGSCPTKGGTTPVVTYGRLFSLDQLDTQGGTIYDADTGEILNSYPASSPPAVGQEYAYFLKKPILYAINLENGKIAWQFVGDGHLTTLPIIINQYVFVGSLSGNVYALNKQNGTVAWTANAGAPIADNATRDSSMPLTGLSAGHGLFVVPAGNSVIAYRLANH